jgi:predicted ArsR family transcriptional regulator
VAPATERDAARLFASVQFVNNLFDKLCIVWRPIIIRTRPIQEFPKVRLERERFEASTRGRIVRLLREQPRTVEELAAALDLTDNAVRPHLTALERDGYVWQTARRRNGPGKPAVVYSLASEADEALSRAYAPFLDAMLNVLADRLSPAELRAIMQQTGRRLAQGIPPAHGDLTTRAQSALAVLEQLGGGGRLEPIPDGIAIQGDGCPIGAVAGTHEMSCAAVASLVAAITGASVRDRCDRRERPRCRMELKARSR